MLGGELTSTPTATASLSAATRTRECTATASAAAAARACVHVCIAIVTHMRREKVRAMERERERGGERDRAVRDGDGSKGGIFLRGHGVRGERERERESHGETAKKKREIFFVDGVIRAVAVAGKGSRPSDDHYGSSWPSNLTLVGLRCCKELMDIRDAMQLSLRHR